jgi:hypothetical protein
LLLRHPSHGNPTTEQLKSESILKNITENLINFKKCSFFFHQSDPQSSEAPSCGDFFGYAAILGLGMA